MGFVKLEQNERELYRNYCQCQFHEINQFEPKGLLEVSLAVKSFNLLKKQILMAVLEVSFVRVYIFADFDLGFLLEYVQLLARVLHFRNQRSQCFSMTQSICDLLYLWDVEFKDLECISEVLGPSVLQAY